MTTKLSKIKKVSLFTPNPAAFARASVKAIGYEASTSPYWTHALQLALMGALPSFITSTVVSCPSCHSECEHSAYSRLRFKTPSRC